MDHLHDKTPNEKRPSFLSGVFLLSLSAVLVKITGLLTKIPMLRLLGAQGMGYYNAAYEVYAALFVLSTAGLPVALSILVSRAEMGRGRILRRAMLLFAAVGLVGSLCLGLFARPIALRIGNPGAEACLRALAPAVLFVCLASAVRGYYQGLGNMRPTAVSQVLEALGKLAFGLALAARACRIGAPLTQIAAAGAQGLTLGTLLALVYLLGRMGADSALGGAKRSGGIVDAERTKIVSRRILRPLCAIAIPITLSAGVTPLTRVLDMVLILRRLRECGYSEEATGALYGIYSTLAIPLYSLLPMLISSLALPLVPGITRARQTGDLASEREMVSVSLRLTCLLGLPASLGLSAFAHPILMLLFGGDEAAVVTATPLLSVLAISVLGGCLVTVLGAMLQAYGCPHVPLWAMLVGSAVKLGTAYVLLGIPHVGMLGAPISTFLCHLSVITVETAVLSRRIPRGVSLRGIGIAMPFSASLAVGGVLLVWRYAESHLDLPRGTILPAVALCALIYLCLVLRTDAVQRRDLESLLGGVGLCRMLNRLGLLKVGEKS